VKIALSTADGIPRAGLPVTVRLTTVRPTSTQLAEAK
jgi:hypothetical protein